MITGLRNTIIGFGLACGVARLFMGSGLVFERLGFDLLPIFPYLVFALITNKKCSIILLITGIVVLGLDIFSTYRISFGEGNAMSGIGMLFVTLFSSFVILPVGLMVDKLFNWILWWNEPL